MSVVDVALSPVRREAVHSSGYCYNQAGDSILIYLSVSGSVIPMRVLKSDSIASVKLRIQTCKGFVVKKQRLVFKGRELARNDSLVKDYGLKGNQPIRSPEGTGGAYFMQDKLGVDYVSIFKPIDEEPMAVNNPHGVHGSSNGEGLKKGTRVGGGAVREVAAYILDHPKSGPRSLSGEMSGFAGVPPTCMVQCLHKGFNHPNGYKCAPENVKVGSLQMYMKNAGSGEDVGPGGFPVEEVHKLSVLDIRMANADRYAGNILIGKGENDQTVLIPIDHGYCLPENFQDCTFDWLYWPQSRQPYSKETIDYIKSLEAEQDVALLRFYGWDVPVECARTLCISTMLLKKAVDRGLTTPFAIGSIMCRETVNKESVIEQIVDEAQDLLLPGMSEAAFMETVSQVMDSWLDKLTN
ncbi:hypothetical protein ERO13_D03G084000v2 [Gossypium hirsutum]|nr:hypothetical protein ERO13_D03G084000v2 [Gossypium hirsutum]